MAAEINLENPIYIGEDQVINETVFQSDRVTIQNVSGYTFSFKLSKADTPVLTITPAIVSAAAGTVTVTLTAAQTAALTSGQYEYHFRRTNAGFNTMLGHGYIEIQDAP